MQVEHPPIDSTRAPALLYPCDMRSPKLLLPLFLILADNARCKDDAPAGSEFGEPCGGDITTPCADGLECYIGYCEEQCTKDSECQPIVGYEHECGADGVCHILCDKACPQTLATPLECVQFACEGAS